MIMQRLFVSISLVVKLLLFFCILNVIVGFDDESIESTTYPTTNKNNQHDSFKGTKKVSSSIRSSPINNSTTTPMRKSNNNRESLGNSLRSRSRSLVMGTVGKSNDQHEYEHNKEGRIQSSSLLDYDILIMIAQFKRKHGLQDDVDVSIHTINDDDNTISIDGQTYWLNDLQPKNVLAPGATITIDGKVTHSLHNLTSTTFVGYQKEEGNSGDTTTTTATTTTVMEQRYFNNGNVRAIDIITSDGFSIYLAPITDGIMGRITSNMMATSLHQSIGSDTYNSGTNESEREEEDVLEKRHPTNRALLLKEKQQQQQIRKMTPPFKQREQQQQHQSKDSSSSTNTTRSLVAEQSTTTIDNDNECSSYYVIELAVAYDSTFCAEESGQESATAEVMAIVERASALFEAQGVCTKISLVHVEAFCDQDLDPFVEVFERDDDNDDEVTLGCSGNSRHGVVQFFRDWIANNPLAPTISYDVYHMMFNNPDIAGQQFGCANQRGMCDNAHGIENMVFSTDINRRASLLAHEIAHHIGAVHIEEVDGVEYIMETIGFGDHIWSPSTLGILTNRIPSLTCLTPPPPTPPPTSSPPIIINVVRRFRLRLLRSNLCLHAPAPADDNNNPTYLIMSPCTHHNAEQNHSGSSAVSAASRAQFFEMDDQGYIRSSSSSTSTSTTQQQQQQQQQQQCLTVVEGDSIQLSECLMEDENDDNINNNHQKWVWMSSPFGANVGTLQSKNRRRCVKGQQRQGQRLNMSSCHSTWFGFDANLQWAMKTESE